MRVPYALFLFLGDVEFERAPVPLIYLSSLSQGEKKSTSARVGLLVSLWAQRHWQVELLLNQQRTNRSGLNSLCVNCLSTYYLASVEILLTCAYKYGT